MTTQRPVRLCRTSSGRLLAPAWMKESELERQLCSTRLSSLVVAHGDNAETETAPFHNWVEKAPAPLPSAYIFRSRVRRRWEPRSSG